MSERKRLKKVGIHSSMKISETMEKGEEAG